MRTKTVFALLLLSSALAGCTNDNEAGPPRGTLAPPPPPRTPADLPECDVEAPSFACVREMFRPLRSPGWAFDADRVGRALDVPGFRVAPTWRLTALHGIEGTSMFPTDCQFDAFRTGTVAAPFDAPGCGLFLLAGGHPRTIDCEREGIGLSTCVDQVPVAEAFDVGVQRVKSSGDALDLAPEAPPLGEEVFVVGNPRFPWLPEEQRRALAGDYPLVSVGRVVAKDGRALVLDALAFGGNSGGPVLDRAGRALGVMYTKVGDVRAQGTPTDPAWQDHYSVAYAVDGAVRASVEEARRGP